jgi:hypothetical protein
MSQCDAITKKGATCKNPSLPGRTRCRLHDKGVASLFPSRESRSRVASPQATALRTHQPARKAQRPWLVLVLILLLVATLTSLLGISRMEQGLAKFVGYYVISVLVSLLLLPSAFPHDRPSQVVVASLMWSWLILLGAPLTQAVLSGLLDAAIDCPKGELISYEQYAVRLPPHSHRKAFGCVPCSETHYIGVVDYEQMLQHPISR